MLSLETSVDNEERSLRTVTGPGVSPTVSWLTLTQDGVRQGSTEGLRAYCEDPKVDHQSPGLSSVSLAGLAAHLPEIRAAAELEPEHQGAVSHSVHIFTLCRRGKKKHARVVQMARGLRKCATVKEKKTKKKPHLFVLVSVNDMSDLRNSLR